jgi:hypothetical protein
MQMIKTLSTLIVLAFAVCNSPASAQQWIEYRPAGEGFRVEMPQAPQVTSRVLQHKIGPLNMIEANVDFTDRSFAVSYVPCRPSGIYADFSVSNAVPIMSSSVEVSRPSGITPDSCTSSQRAPNRADFPHYAALLGQNDHGK